MHGSLLAHAGPGELPPPLTAARLLTTWEPEPLPVLAVAAAAAAYLYGVRRLRASGVPWSPWRTASFCLLGLGAVLVATTSALAAYDTTLISVHMGQHMLLNMVAPIFLVLGAPVTLALRTLPARPRGLLVAALHSRVARVLTFPVVAGALFVINPFALYLTGWYEATLRNPWLHDLNHVHFVLVGYLWFESILGVDPLPSRPAHLFRLLAVVVTLPFHAFLGITLLGAADPLAENWYAGLGRTWPPSLLRDQEWAGGILWAVGDLVGLVVVVVLFAQWVRASEREAVREDRRLDRLDRLGVTTDPRP
ncbi:MAG: cytochrome c oxidase assembly protein [Actinomycetota bacterium]|nr:cytochrome c oxidase assembly protein [Actinomycetota bacterium]